MTDDFWVYPLRWGETVADQEWVPLYFHRLLGSDLVAEACAAGESGRAALGTAMLLWFEAVKQDPAGTLPDSDVTLARLAGYGPDLDGWRKVRPLALHGWQAVTVEEDGDRGAARRLGHRTIAQVCLYAWQRKDGRRAGREAAHLATVKNRVKDKLVAMKKPHRVIEDDDLRRRIAEWLIRGGMKVTTENVASALAACGALTLLPGLKGHDGD